MSDKRIQLPVLHQGQQRMLQQSTRFTAVRCGRRWGKSFTLETIAASYASNGMRAGIFAPTYKTVSEQFTSIATHLDPIIKSSNSGQGAIRTINGGHVDTWSLDHNKRAGRGRKYHVVLLDETAFNGPDMMDIWRLAIKPTLLDYRGRAFVFSTPNGVDEENFFYQVCTNPKYGFTEYYAPTSDNPEMSKEELADLQRTELPEAFGQEYGAQFIDWSGTAIIQLQPFVADPVRCDYVVAIIDSAIKDGVQHDGTGVSYFARNMYDTSKPPLVLIDWELHQIQGGSLINWLPTVHQRVAALARQCGAVQQDIGIPRVFIEDKASGSILLQQCRDLSLPVSSIPSAFTAMGKDARAMAISSYAYLGKVRFSEYAYHKQQEFKKKVQNHQLTQVTTFRLGDKDASKRADDLLDTFCYGILCCIDKKELTLART